MKRRPGGQVGVKRSVIPWFALGLISGSANADELPPLPPDLMNVSAVSCIKINTAGAIGGAFLIHSTGDSGRDRHLLEWIKQLHWPVAKPGEKLRNTWFPMPIAIGGAPALEPPPTCGPSAQGLPNTTSPKHKPIEKPK